MIFVYLIDNIRFSQFFFSRICLHAGLWVCEQWEKNHKVKGARVSGLIVEGNRKGEKLCDLGHQSLYWIILISFPVSRETSFWPYFQGHWIIMQSHEEASIPPHIAFQEKYGPENRPFKACSFFLLLLDST